MSDGNSDEPGGDNEDTGEEEHVQRLENICVLCFENTGEGELMPCRCGNSVHRECLKHIYMYYELQYPTIDSLECTHCNTVMSLRVRPKKGAVVKVLQKIRHHHNRFCKLAFKCILAITVQHTFAIMGLANLYQIYGKTTADEMISSMGPMKAVALCQIISIITMGINSIWWEDKLLTGLRRCSRLPVVGCMFPREYPNVTDIVPMWKPRLDQAVAGLLLPWYADLFGFLIFGSVESKLHRVLLGGATFLFARGVLYMYRRQKEYSRRGGLSVAGFEES